jgi:hypothetical protein
MKIRLIFLLLFSFLITQAAFGGSLCTDRAGSPTGSVGNLVTQYDCTFTLNPSVFSSVASPYDLTPYMFFGIDPSDTADEAANLQGAGYVVFTNDPGNIDDQSAWKEVLFFEPYTPGDFTTGSDSVFLYWNGGPVAFPSTTTMDNAIINGLASVENVPWAYTVQWSNTGSQLLAPPDGNETFTILDAAVPEPSTLLLGFTAAVGILIAKRRRA